MSDETVEQKIRRRHYVTRTVTEPRDARSDPEWEADEIAYLEEQRSRRERRVVRQIMQDEIWYPTDGRVLAVDDLSPRHRQNLIAWLERNAASIGRQYLSDLIGSASLASGDGAQAGVEHIIAQAEREIAEDPVAWIRTTPLLTRLIAREALYRQRSARAKLAWRLRRLRSRDGRA